jgi:hypothetical protein
LRRFRAASPEYRALTEITDQTSWPAVPSRTIAAARAAYLWLPSNTLLWMDRNGYEPSDAAAIRGLLAAVA